MRVGVEEVPPSDSERVRLAMAIVAGSEGVERQSGEEERRGANALKSGRAARSGKHYADILDVLDACFDACDAVVVGFAEDGGVDWRQ